MTALDTRRLDADGYAWAPPIALAPVPRGPTAPKRDVLRIDSWLRALATSASLARIASDALRAPAFPVRANLFAKTAGANWSVPWHQDRAVCVAERADVEGFAGWTIKGGLHHVNAPCTVLERIVGLRVHLDPCPADAGALEVHPGSHRRVLTDDEARALGVGVLLPARRGDVLVMKPLLVHRSRSLASPAHRRVLHVEFAAAPLPSPLRWTYGPPRDA